MALNSFNKSKFSRPFDSKYSSEESINKTALNMGALHYVHTAKILEAMTQARVDDDPAMFYRLLKSLFAISQTKISDLVDVINIKKKLRLLQINVTKYDYYKHCLYSEQGNPNALEPLQYESYHIWNLCENIFKNVFIALDKKGMILPDKENDNFGKFLGEFGVTTGDIFNGNNN